jgi:hypothetical protein
LAYMLFYLTGNLGLGCDIYSNGFYIFELG